ncbi:MAG: radical SAM protein [Elusimicrobiota bacterium]
MPAAPLDFARSPSTVVWETTHSCELACAYCRDASDATLDPRELNTDEGLRLVDQAADLGARTLVFSGGDPLVRLDLEILVRRARSRELRSGALPAATRRLTKERLAALKSAGLDYAAFSLDGAIALDHDSFRRAPGAFARAVEAAAWAADLGLAAEINTCLGAWNVESLESIIRLVSSLPIARWNVYFLVPLERGGPLAGLTPAQFEIVFDRLYRLTFEADFDVNLVEGQHFRRFVARREAPGEAAADAVADRAVNAGDGTMFVDHVGAICPSEFLREPRGDIRSGSLASVYRDDPLFVALRDRGRLTGKCWVCEYRQICGGSRARAPAATGDAWAPDPACSYVPAIMR